VLRIGTIWMVAFSLLVSLGCGRSTTTVVPGRQDANASSSKAESALLGRYSGKVEVTPAGKDDPMAKFGEALGGMLMSGTELELRSGNRFALTMLGMLLEGPFVEDGDTITLKPETIGGLTPKEFEKVSRGKQSGPSAEALDKPMILKRGPEGSLRVTGESSGGALTFVKRAPVPPAQVTVPEADRTLIGDWRPQFEPSRPDPSLSETERLEQKLQESALRTGRLELRGDGRFELTMVMEFKGKWSRQGNKLRLAVESVGIDMPGVEEKSSDNEPMILEVREGGKILRLLSNRKEEPKKGEPRFLDFARAE